MSGTTSSNYTKGPIYQSTKTSCQVPSRPCREAFHGRRRRLSELPGPGPQAGVRGIWELWNLGISKPSHILKKQIFFTGIMGSLN